MAIRIMKILDNIINRKLYMAYREVFDLDSPSVKIVLSDMCKAHSVFSSGFDANPYLNALSSGERNAVLRILAILNTKPDDIIKLSQEEDDDDQY